jgi:hypothetical protein
MQASKYSLRDSLAKLTNPKLFIQQIKRSIKNTDYTDYTYTDYKEDIPETQYIDDMQDMQEEEENEYTILDQWGNVMPDMLKYYMRVGFPYFFNPDDYDYFYLCHLLELDTTG